MMFDDTLASALLIPPPRGRLVRDVRDRLMTALAGRYSIERKLGSGGMAVVYLAEDLRLERRVAIKVLRPELASVVAAERFLREIKLTANLHHPHILPLHESGTADGLLYYVRLMSGQRCDVPTRPTDH